MTHESDEDGDDAVLALLDRVLQPLASSFPGCGLTPDEWEPMKKHLLPRGQRPKAFVRELLDRVERSITADMYGTRTLRDYRALFQLAHLLTENVVAGFAHRAPGFQRLLNDFAVVSRGSADTHALARALRVEIASVRAELTRPPKRGVERLTQPKKPKHGRPRAGDHAIEDARYRQFRESQPISIRDWSLANGHVADEIEREFARVRAREALRKKSRK